MANYLTEAFRELQALKEDTFDLSKNGVEELEKFLAGDDVSDLEIVYDTNAEDEQDLEDSYDGDAILQCVVCNSKMVASSDDVVIDDSTDVVNIDEPCPQCGATSGYKIVGQVSVYNSDDTDIDDESMQESFVEESRPKRVRKASFLTEKRDDTEDLWDTVGGMLDGTKDRQTINKNTGKPQVVGNKPLYDADQIGIDDDGYFVWVYDENEAESAKKVADRFKLKSFLGKPERVSGPNRRFHITIPETRAYEQTPLYMDTEKELELVTESTNESCGKIGKQTIKEDVKVDSMLLGKLARKALTYGYKYGYETSIDDFLDTLEPSIRSALTDEQIYELEDAFDEGERRAFYEEPLKASSYHIREAMTEEPINESVENVVVETNSDTITVTPEDSGNITVQTSSKDTPDVEEETIIPVTDTLKDEIEMNDDNFDEESTEDIDLDNIEIESFDELSESYLKKVYTNVASFKTLKSSYDKGKFLVEGIITFNSGAKTITQFSFDAQKKLRNGLYKFTGLNEAFSKSKNAFSISVNDKGICESLTYRYTGTDAKTNKKVVLYGRVQHK